MAAAVRAVYDKNAPVRNFGGQLARSGRIPIGNDYWTVTMQDVKYGAKPVRCVVITRAVNGYKGGTDKEIWTIPFDQCSNVTVEYQGWHEYRKGTMKANASI